MWLLRPILYILALALSSGAGVALADGMLRSALLLWIAACVLCVIVAETRREP